MIYNTPSCDVTLVCSDDVKVTAHSHLLRTFSSIMNDMMGASALTVRDSQPLELAESSYVVKEFLNLAYDGPDPVNLDLAVDTARCCDKYCAPRLTKSLLQCLHVAASRSPSDAWKVFGIASQIQDPDLAAAAILHFGESHRTEPAKYRGKIQAHRSFSDWLPNDVDHVSSAYLAMYVKAQLRPGAPHTVQETNLSVLSADFLTYVPRPYPGCSSACPLSVQLIGSAIKSERRVICGSGKASVRTASSDLCYTDSLPCI